MRWLLVGLFLLLGTAAGADELRPGYVELRQVDRGHWSLNWKQPLTRAGEPRLVVPLIPRPCRLVDGPHQRVVALALVGGATLECRGSLAGARIGYRELLGGGDALVRVVPRGKPAQNYRLTPAEPSLVLAVDEARNQVWRTYGLLGVEHILSGWDHVLFVIALVLLVQRGWAVVSAVTAFTVAHSLTLAGTTLGLVGLPARPVEAIIALSIVFLALELVRGRERRSLTVRYPWAIAFAFGLFHGFGFAGALREIGLPEGEIPAALLAFNLGVEAGQLAVVVAVLVVLWAVRRSAPAALASAIRIAGYGIGITASYWLIERLVA